MKILAVADVESKKFYEYYSPGKLRDYDLILACGDLRVPYLEFLVTMARCPVLYVHGNHDERFAREPEGCELIEANKKKFGVWNLHVVSGSAPEALADLPAPDRVFIGGSDGTLEEIMDAALEKNGDALICVSAIVLETMADTVKAMADRGMDTDIIQVCVNTSKQIRDRHMMMAGNPIYIITGKKNA